MWLKKIEINGFKSFMEKTVLEFGPGISVIVGPNGCGKSNIVEAVCWAMGEQGLRPLRARCSEDLIFAGTREFPPASFCEVTLVFDNQSGGAPPEFNQYSEIEITRRLSRWGESEYLINRTGCRLKDITEFFLGTGLGKQAYSIIGQGEVERILQAKPEEIRSMIEEAAGISKYRFRRDEALRKIQLTRENLTRLRDILSELERQLNSLSRQAKKAERGQRYKEEIKALELEVFAYRGLMIKDKIQKIEAERNEKQSQLALWKNRLNQEELEEEDKRARLDLITGELAREYEENYRLKSQLEQLEAGIKSLARQEELLQGALEKRGQEILDCEARIQELESEISLKLKAKEALEIELLSLRADLEHKSREWEQKFEGSKKQKILYDSLQEQLHSLEQELVRLQEKEKNLLWQEARTREDLEHTQKELEALEPVLGEDRQRSFDFNQSLHQLQKNLEELEQKLAEKQSSLDRLRDLVAEKSGGIRELENQYQALSARWANLKEMVEKLEGIERGVRYILEKKRAQGEVNGVYRLVGDLIETEPEYEVAVEAILGEQIQSVVVQTPEQGLEAINLLRSESAGRGTFIPLSLRVPGEQVIPEHIRSAGAKPLLELVRIKPGFEPVVKYLLGQSVLVSDLEQAIHLWEANGFGGAFVTPEGAILDPHGVLTGGSKDQAGFLSKKRELRELEIERASLKLKLEQAESELNLFSGQQREQEKELEQLKNRKHHLELAVLNQRKDLQQATDDLNEKLKTQEQLRKKSQELSEQIFRFSREQAELAKRKAELDAVREKLKAELENLTREMETMELELARVSEERNRLRTEQASLKEKIFAVEDARLRFQKMQEEQIARREQLKAELSEGERSLQELKQTQAQNQQEIERLISLLELQAKRIEELTADKNQLEQALHQVQEAVKEIRAQIRGQEEGLYQLELEYEREKMNFEHQKQLLNEIYQEELEKVMEEARGRLNLDEFQLEPRLERVEELRKLLIRMGPINPTALEEYKEIESRYSFLSNQEADLVNGLSQLEETIRRINQEYKKRFKSTFDQVNLLFQDLFPKLFGGGKAVLALADENNLLESGIEIIAQPPGKKFQNLSLLSGGEKSLTAIALIFALYLNRPSPFCLLDEIDSALDELNIDRFNQLLRKVAQNSQILLVTHNKRTMELADRLYGVTMEKPGVSTIVSVKLEEYA